MAKIQILIRKIVIQRKLYDDEESRDMRRIGRKIIYNDLRSDLQLKRYLYKREGCILKIITKIQSRKF